MNERAKIIGRNVALHRSKAGLSQAKLAELIGAKSQNTIVAIESGETQKSKYLHDIARVLSVKMRDIDPESPPEETQVVKPSDLLGEHDLPVHASVEGGEGELVVSNEPIDSMRRPASLAHVKGAYGVIVKGDSMAPVVRAGAIVLVNPHLAPQRDDVCLFIYDADGDFRATLKEYCGQTETAWQVKRYSPKERKFTLPKKEWPRCDVVVGVQYRR